MPPVEMVIPRSPIRIGVEPTLRSHLARLAAGRPLVLDYFASRRCSIVVGDLTADFRRRAPGRAYVALKSLEGVPLFANERLLPVLEEAELTLRLGGPVFARHLAITLEPASRWIDFLEEPTVLAEGRPFWTR